MDRRYGFAIAVGVVALVASSGAHSAPLEPMKKNMPSMRPSKQLPGLSPSGSTGGVTVGGTTTSNGRFTIPPGGTVVLDNTSGRVWERAPNMTSLRTWAAAKAYCDGKNLAGRDDWRLPRTEELKGLFNGPYDSPLPPDHPFTIGGSGGVWSSTDVQVTAAHSLLPANGNVFSDLMTKELGAWCVRGGGNTAYPNTNPRFKVVQQTVEDTLTGRVWARQPEGQASWYDARIACRARGADWRLATRDELLGLIDTNAPESPKLPVGHPFNNTWTPYDQNPMWTLDSVDASKARAVKLADGSVVELPKTDATHGGFCVKMDAAASWPAGSSGRFVPNADGLTVVDQETRLLWERSPTAPGAKWPQIDAACAGKSTGGLTGWRQPTIEEVRSLIDFRAATAVKLPPNHPFLDVQPVDHWTATKLDNMGIRTIRMSTGQPSQMSQSGSNMPGWCVRPAP
ncbi:MAG: DUF1566 domain-containing protein [Myxococcales bacterium]|nr:DUF1566 domain-containing protein [Myxococcales bacterium]